MIVVIITMIVVIITMIMLIITMMLVIITMMLVVITMMLVIITVIREGQDTVQAVTYQGVLNVSLCASGDKLRSGIADRKIDFWWLMGVSN